MVRSRASRQRSHARACGATPGQIWYRHATFHDPDARRASRAYSIVDDEKFIRDILADFLGMEGYVVRTAEDGAAALSELDHARYDMVISDLKMPQMGGIELLEAIGTRRRTR